MGAKQLSEREIIQSRFGTDDRLCMNHEHLIDIARQLGDYILYINLGGKLLQTAEGLKRIRDSHTMYPNDQSKHDPWIAYGKKFVYFTSCSHGMLWLNFIPIALKNKELLESVIPERYGDDQFGYDETEVLYE